VQEVVVLALVFPKVRTVLVIVVVTVLVVVDMTEPNDEF